MIKVCYVDLEILKAIIRKCSKCNYSKKENVTLDILKAVMEHKICNHGVDYNGQSKR